MKSVPCASFWFSSLDIDSGSEVDPQEHCPERATADCSAGIIRLFLMWSGPYRAVRQSPKSPAPKTTLLFGPNLPGLWLPKSHLVSFQWENNSILALRAQGCTRRLCIGFGAGLAHSTPRAHGTNLGCWLWKQVRQVLSKHEKSLIISGECLLVARWNAA